MGLERIHWGREVTAQTANQRQQGLREWREFPQDFATAGDHLGTEVVRGRGGIGGERERRENVVVVGCLERILFVCSKEIIIGVEKVINF